MIQLPVVVEVSLLPVLLAIARFRRLSGAAGLIKFDSYKLSPYDLKCMRAHDCGLRAREKAYFFGLLSGHPVDSNY